MGISQYIKEIGRGKQGARSISREQAADLFGQVLDGAVTDLEIGAFCLAMRIKGETPEEMCGFLDATYARLHRVPSSGASCRRAAQLQRRAQAARAHALVGFAGRTARPAGAHPWHGHGIEPRLRAERAASTGHPCAARDPGE